MQKSGFQYVTTMIWRGASLLFSSRSINPFHILLSGSKTAANAPRIPPNPTATTPAMPSRAGRKPGTSAASSRPPNADPRPKYYVLEMFPYPSGRIHMGHVRNYTMGDVVARYKRATRLQRAASDGLGRLRHAGRERRDGAQGPSQGLDLRQHRRDEGAAASRWGCRSTGAREIATCDPAYYKHQQQMFLDFLKAGLVERKQSKVNWDPVDKTVLANEQVIDGRGWRSGARGRAARADAVVLQDHRLLARICSTRSTRSTAGRRKSG